MTEVGITPEEFAERCRTDNYFATRAVAAALSNAETNAVFNAALSQAQSGEGAAVGGIQIKSCYSISYNLTPVQQQLSMSLSSAQGGPGVPPVAPNQFTLLSYNGEFTGLMVEAARLMRIFAPGPIITALIQALFGTKAGMPLLLILLAL